MMTDQRNKRAADGMTTSGGQTVATSGNHYFASRNFAASFVIDPDNNQKNEKGGAGSAAENTVAIDASARKKQTMSG